MDISETLAPNSDQLDAIELVSGPRTFTIEKVSKGNAEQPVNVHLVGFPRPWRPGKSMRRVLAACWGSDASVWVGRRVTLYCDETVQFGGKAVGGTRISHLSHIDKPKSVPLLVTRGKSAMFTVEPLPEPSRIDQPAEPAAPDEVAQLVALIAAEGITKSDMPRFVSAAVGRDITHPSQLSYVERGDLIDDLPALAANFKGAES